MISPLEPKESIGRWWVRPLASLEYSQVLGTVIDQVDDMGLDVEERAYTVKYPIDDECIRKTK